MTTTTNNTNDDAAAGRAAGEAFARSRASVSDHQVLREVLEAEGDGPLLGRLFAAYADDGLSHDETAALLFGDASARPSPAYVAGFLEGAIAALEAAFGGPDEDDEDDGPGDEEDTVWGSLGEALVTALDGCVENGMSYPMIIMVVGSNGSVVAARLRVRARSRCSWPSTWKGRAWTFRSTAWSRTRTAARRMSG
jgi:hypothetical protein